MPSEKMPDTIRAYRWPKEAQSGFWAIDPEPRHSAEPYVRLALVPPAEIEALRRVKYELSVVLNSIQQEETGEWVDWLAMAPRIRSALAAVDAARKEADDVAK